MKYKKLLLGFYSGIGDFISAVPVTNSLSKNFILYCAVSIKLKDLIDCMNLTNVNFLYFYPKNNIVYNLKFFLELRSYNFENILFSPHAQYLHSSFFFPLIIKLFSNKYSKLIGAKKQKLSFLFNEVIDINMNQPIMLREISFLEKAGFIEEQKINYNFNYNVDIKMKENLVVFHVGASKNNRRFNNAYLKDLIKLIISDKYKLIVMGINSEIKELASFFNDFPKQKLSFSCSSISESINTIHRAKVCLTMDSGFGHIASSLGVKHLFICGPADPNLVKPIFKNTKILFKLNHECQPCNNYLCNQEENYCLSRLDKSNITKFISENFY